MATMIDPNGTTGMAETALTLSAAADAHTVARFRTELSQWLRVHFALDPLRHNDVLLAVNEALTNVAEFAYGGHRGAVTMAARHSAADGTLAVEVSDQGKWRHTDPQARSNTRGRGIPLMRALTDEADISQLASGTRVRLLFRNCALISAASFAVSV